MKPLPLRGGFFVSSRWDFYIGYNPFYQTFAPLELHTIVLEGRQYGSTVETTDHFEFSPVGTTGSIRKIQTQIDLYIRFRISSEEPNIPLEN